MLQEGSDCPPGCPPAATGDGPPLGMSMGISPPMADAPCAALGLVSVIPCQGSALPKASLLVRHNPVISQLLSMDENRRGAERVEDFNTYPSLTATERESSLVVDIILL